MSQLMRLWHFLFSVNSFFKRACAAIQWGYMSDFFVGPFVYFHTWCVQTAKALARLRGCAGSSKPSLDAFMYVISTVISWAGSYCVREQHLKVLVRLQGCSDSPEPLLFAYVYQFHMKQLNFCLCVGGGRLGWTPCCIIKKRNMTGD